MKGRSLEDLNQMFEQRVPIRDFGSFTLEHNTHSKADDGPQMGNASEEKIGTATIDETVRGSKE
jgi:hypothetical protein